MKTTEETITPRKAQELLDKHWNKENQRRPSPAVVDQYARSMGAGQWLLTHQGIAIDDADELIDGVHRLLAVVQSGATIRTQVTRGVPHNGATGRGGIYTIDAIDRGRLRAVGQQLQLRHGCTNGNAVAAVTRTILMLAAHSEGYNIGTMTVGNALRVLDHFGAEVRHCVSERSYLPGLRSAAAIGAFAFAMRPYPAEIKEAYQQFVTGENLVRGNPMLSLRNFLQANRIQGNVGTNLSFPRATLQACEKHVLKENLLAVKSFSEQGYLFFLEKQRPTVGKLLTACGYEKH